ncbi:pimeloyl-ACP methyl ester carboxylesterase [Rhodococcus sp. SMB37]|uniref:alpha/beta fold hydrolase n=1 Tax=Rhodococcus sp. SMB37 TaxID=2512213 RepID=UPI0010516562|nr:alpha/beta hydrolase [Rhodococcus sp. SMB37]TCN45104.1 pimeloyl-ACP methyl ester carboxylesterase [Rhodococcus sp. SMB37]
MIEARYLDIGGALGFVEIVTPDRHDNDHRDTDPAALPAILCIHTAGQSGVQWRHVARSLANLGYRVIVPDLPGHGRSEPAPCGPVTSIVDYGDWLCSVLDALGIERPYVIGCSIGGKLTLELATRPGRPLSGAIAMEAEAGPGRVNVNGLRRELEDVAGPARAERTYLGTLASVGRSVPEAKAHVVALMHKREDPEISSSDLIGWGTHDVRDRLDQVTAPLHVVAGRDDPWIVVDEIARVAEMVNEIAPGRARFTALDGIGHYPMEEIDDFAALVDTWIGELKASVQAEEISL